MIAETPSLHPAIEAVADYVNANGDTLSSEHVEILLEVGRRLERLQTQAAELIEINNRMWDKQGFKVEFDAQTDTVIFSSQGVVQRLKLNRADPNVPIKMHNATASSAYHAGNSEPTDEEEARLRVELEEKLESYYQSAHRVLKLFGRIPNFRKVKCIPVSRVRNELIEHPEDGALYSFGTGSTGPRVKPMHRGTPKFNDEGLVPNTRAFVEAIVAACGGDAS
jgi:hypothetical protein